MKKLEATLGLRAYARHAGVSPGTVARWLKSGRLERAVTRGPRGPLIDVALADAESQANRDPAKVREHNTRRPKRLTLDELHPAVAAVYTIRHDLEAFTDAVWRMTGRQADCAAVLAFIQALPIHLRVIEDELAARGVPLFDTPSPQEEKAP